MLLLQCVEQVKTNRDWPKSGKSKGGDFPFKLTIEGAPRLTSPSRSEFVARVWVCMLMDSDSGKTDILFAQAVCFIVVIYVLSLLLSQPRHFRDYTHQSIHGLTCMWSMMRLYYGEREVRKVIS